MKASNLKLNRNEMEVLLVGRRMSPVLNGVALLLKEQVCNLGLL